MIRLFNNKNKKGNTPTFNVRGIGLTAYQFDKALNRFVYNIGSSFKAISQGLRKFLHTGYWRRYALVIFFAIISLVVIGLLL
ncbi:MAG: hypothetical protein ACMUJM_03205 [bacterium]